MVPELRRLVIWRKGGVALVAFEGRWIIDNASRDGPKAGGQQRLTAMRSPSGVRGPFAALQRHTASGAPLCAGAWHAGQDRCRGRGHAGCHGMGAGSGPGSARRGDPRTVSVTRARRRQSTRSPHPRRRSAPSRALRRSGGNRARGTARRARSGWPQTAARSRFHDRPGHDDESRDDKNLARARHTPACARSANPKSPRRRPIPAVPPRPGDSFRAPRLCHWR